MMKKMTDMTKGMRMNPNKMKMPPGFKGKFPF